MPRPEQDAEDHDDYGGSDETPWNFRTEARSGSFFAACECLTRVEGAGGEDLRPEPERTLLRPAGFALAPEL